MHRACLGALHARTISPMALPDSRVFALVVAYQPQPGDLTRLLAATAPQVSGGVIVHNGTASQWPLADDETRRHGFAAKTAAKAVHALCFVLPDLLTVSTCTALALANCHQLPVQPVCQTGQHSTEMPQDHA